MVRFASLPIEFSSGTQGVITFIFLISNSNNFYRNMPIQTRSQACSVQPTEQVASPRANTPRRILLSSSNVTPRRRLRSRQGNAGVIVSIDAGGPSFIIAGGQVPESFLISICANARCKTCPN